jgi:succinate dehydrogenase/fumarate reductase flavoprotein subunit
VTDADVLVVGGGLAATWTALSAAQAGGRVVLVNKGYCGTSGVTATAGVSHWFVPPADHERAVAARYAASGELADPERQLRVLRTTWERLPTLDRYYPFPKTGGAPDRVGNVRGPAYLRIMRGLVHRGGSVSSTTIRRPSCWCGRTVPSVVRPESAGRPAAPGGFARARWCWRPVAPRSARTYSARGATPATGT